jgi:hypothetical protein
VSGPTLTVVVPALDEEQAIGSTLRRCIAARAQIMAEAGLGAVEIIAVSDGSTDRTEAIAREIDGVSVLVFEKNRGYGTAIQTGFAYGRGELVGFLDADGTCDPLFFGPLARAVVDGADLALGSRMGRDSEMPRIRAVGNAIFAWILGILAKQRLEDTASGMRVIRRSALPDLYPLPAGLHFTPAMSARALLEGKLRLVELPMPYAERVGAFEAARVARRHALPHLHRAGGDRLSPGAAAAARGSGARARGARGRGGADPLLSRPRAPEGMDDLPPAARVALRDGVRDRGHGRSGGGVHRGRGARARARAQRRDRVPGRLVQSPQPPLRSGVPARRGAADRRARDRGVLRHRPTWRCTGRARCSRRCSWCSRSCSGSPRSCSTCSI